jgi:hypothetical protein
MISARRRSLPGKKLQSHDVKQVMKIMHANPEYTVEDAIAHHLERMPPEAPAAEHGDIPFPEAADMLRDDGSHAETLAYAAGKQDAAVRATMEKAKTATAAGARDAAAQAALAKEMADAYEAALKQAHAEGRLPDEDMRELEAINEQAKEIEGKLGKYESLAACMTQEVA